MEAYMEGTPALRAENKGDGSLCLTHNCPSRETTRRWSSYDTSLGLTDNCASSETSRGRIRRHAARGLRLTVVLLLASLLMGCGQAKEEHSLLPDSLRLQVGDVVFRRCTGLTSRVVMMSDREGIFSHTGIVADSAGQLMVVHAVPGESERRDEPDRVKMEPLGRFFSSRQAVAAGVARPKDAEAGRRAAEYALRRYREGTLFDHDFDDNDTTRLYCTQLVTLAYRQAGVRLVDSVPEIIDLPSFHYRCILPSQLLQSPQLQIIFTHETSKKVRRKH